MTVGYLKGDNSTRARGDPHVAHHNDLADAVNAAGGGSQPDLWGPYDFAGADYVPDLGNGVGGILLDVEFPIGSVLIGCFVRVLTDLQENFYVDAGVIAEDSVTMADIFTGGMFPNTAASYVQGTSYDDLHCSGPNSPDGFGPVKWKHIATAWIETADVVSSGTGKVWFQVLTPGLP